MEQRLETDLAIESCADIEAFFDALAAMSGTAHLVSFSIACCGIRMPRGLRPIWSEVSS